jgi:hypothetical protein
MRYEDSVYEVVVARGLIEVEKHGGWVAIVLFAIFGVALRIHEL